MGKPKNSMSVEAFKAEAAIAALPWQELEKKVEGVWKANGWDCYRERVIPRKAFAGLRLPPGVLARIMALVQKLGRRKGWPDLYVAKRFADVGKIPPALLAHLAPEKLRTLLYHRGPLVVTGAVEIKQGAGEETEGQLKWLGYAELCPGQFALVARSSNYERMVAMAGGIRP